MASVKPYQVPKQLIWEAWKCVKKSAGSAGIDNQSIDDFAGDLSGNLYKIWNRMSSGSYFPPAVMGLPIPKKSGGTRVLGVPTVSDRVAQTAVKLLIEPELEKTFLSDSYGYRPNKSAHDAINITRIRCWKYPWVLEFDIKGLFDNIPWDLLKLALRRHVKCKWALLYIERWLEAPLAYKNGDVVERTKGTPQGGCISPILSNLFMHYCFDKWMEKEFSTISWCRYADDGLLHCRSLEEADYMKQKLAQRLKECGLELQPDKTKIVYCGNNSKNVSFETNKFDFLGYTFETRTLQNKSDGKLFDGFTPAASKSALKSMRRTIKYVWKIESKLHHDLKSIANAINPKIRGWISYYGKFSKWVLQPIFESVNERLRKWARRKYKKLAKRKTQSCYWLKRVYKSNPKLFVHWQEVPVC